MVNVHQYPYFSYGDQLSPLLEPLYAQAPIIFLGLKRCFPQLKLILLSHMPSKQMVCDIYNKEMYRYGYFPNDAAQLKSGFHMWDHLELGASQNMANFMYDNHKFAHALTIIQQHGDYCDGFIFGSPPENSDVNNFYLNKKEMFEDFIAEFYRTMAGSLSALAEHKLSLPQDIIKDVKPLITFSPRQLECAELMIKGHTSKEIARILNISHRTVNDHIDVMRKKTNAKNRSHLIYYLLNL